MDTINKYIEQSEPTREEVLNKGLRYNKGKLRYDLVHPVAEKGLVQVLTKGSEKYAERNWEKGMKWSNVISSLKRHLAAIEAGEDYDSETGLLHADHLQCNAHFLSAYYKIYPEGDDRPHTYLKKKRIGLDIDGVLCNFIDKYYGDLGIDKVHHWNSTYRGDFKIITADDDFWLNLEPLMNGKELPFEPCCYITHRPCSSDISQQWLEKHGFPCEPVITVKGSKVQACIDNKVDIFVDDKYENFVQLNEAGICCYLYDASYNQRYNVGHKRIYSLKELA